MSTSNPSDWAAFVVVPVCAFLLCTIGLVFTLIVGFRNMIQFPKLQKQRRKEHRKQKIHEAVFPPGLIPMEEYETPAVVELGTFGNNVLNYVSNQKKGGLFQSDSEMEEIIVPERRVKFASSTPTPVKNERKDLSRNTSLRSINSWQITKQMNSATSVTSRSILSLYAPLLVIVSLFFTLAMICVIIFTSVTMHQVVEHANQVETYRLELVSSPSTRKMVESYGTKYYVESLLTVPATNTSVALYGVYSSNVTMRILLFKEKSLYDEFNASSTIDYYSSDVKEINNTSEGVILSSWRLWDNSTVTTGNGMQNFTVLIQVENSSLPYSMVFHFIVEDENYSLVSNFLGFVWMLFIEVLVCLACCNQIYLAMISYDPTNREHFLDEWLSLFQCFSKKNQDENKEKDVTIEFKDLSFKSFEGKQILKNISGRIEAGKLTAVMGGTGRYVN